MTIAEQKDIRIEKVFGTLEFRPEDREKRVYFKIYKRMNYETDMIQNTFAFNIKFA